MTRSSLLFNMLAVCGMAAIVAGLLAGRRSGDDRWRVYFLLGDLFLIAGNLIAAVSQALARDWGHAALSLAFLAWWIFEAWRDWRNWRDRRKVAKALGAKSRALRDSLVKRMRNSTMPRPVRVPQ